MYKWNIIYQRVEETTLKIAIKNWQVTKMLIRNKYSKYFVILIYLRIIGRAFIHT